MEFSLAKAQLNWQIDNRMATEKSQITESQETQQTDQTNPHRQKF